MPTIQQLVRFERVANKKKTKSEPRDPQNQKFAKKRSRWTPRDPGNPPKRSVSTRSKSEEYIV